MTSANHPDRDLADDLTYLRLHVAACWSVLPPPLSPGEHALLAGGAAPPWTVYVAETAAGRVILWHPDALARERAAPLARAAAAIARPADDASDPGVTREVALRQTAPPLDLVGQAVVVRLLTAADGALIAAFDPDDPTYYVRAEVAPVFGAVVDGRLQSVAHSSRRTPDACELGVHTRPEARQRGYGLAVTTRWAAAVRAEGRVPIYSARASNTASLALARAAGFHLFARAAYIPR